MRALRSVAGWACLLVGVAVLALFTQAFIRGGCPEGLKAPAYLWLLTLVGLLPASVGGNLLWLRVQWGRFAGWWLVAMGAVYLAGFALAMPEILRNYRIDWTILVFAEPPLALVSGGGFLIAKGRRAPEG